MNINLDIILYIATAIITISSTVGILNKILTRTIENTTKEVISKEMKETNEKLDKQISEMRDYLNSYIESNNSENKLMRDTLLAMARDRINQAHIFYVQNGYIGAHSMAVLEDLYSSYHKLGGNGFVSKEMNDIRELELISTEDIIHENEVIKNEHEKFVKQNVGEDS